MREKVKKIETMAKIITIVCGSYTLVALVCAFNKVHLPFADASAILFALAAIAWAFTHDELVAYSREKKK